jgi:hypothetical protein
VSDTNISDTDIIVMSKSFFIYFNLKLGSKNK